MDTPPENDPIGDYLSRVLLWIFPSTPAEREELQEELSQHIAAMAAAEEAQGAVPSDAVAAALKRMGDADDLGERLNKARLERYDLQAKARIPPKMKSNLIGYIGLTSIWSAGALLLMLRLISSHDYFPSCIILGGIAGIGHGVLEALFKSRLPGIPATLREKVRRVDENDISNSSLSSSLPANASSRGKREFLRHQKYLASVNDFAIRLKSYESIRLYYFKPRELVKQIAYFTLAVVVSIIFRNESGISGSAAIVAMYLILGIVKQLTAFAFSRYLYNRSTQK